MLELKVHDGERDVVLQFEHSLLALSKWESKHKIAFLASPTKTADELIDYYQDMLLGDVDKNLVYALAPGQLDELSKYINDPMSASTVPVDPDAKRSMEITTSELIYYWMVALQIPFSTETWHLNRLMMLISITSYKNQPEKKRSKGEMLNKWREMNAKNKERFGTNG